MKPVKFSLKTVLVIVALHFLFGGKLITRLQAQDEDTFIYSLIIDKTGSMMGRGDGMGDTIWFEVQHYLRQFVDMIDLNTKVIVYPFHGVVDPPVSFYLNNQAAKDELRSYLRSMVPDGRNTAIYKALDDALADLENNYPNNPKLIYLITDGRDNDTLNNYTFQQNMEKFAAIRGEFDHLYYIDLRNRAYPSDILIADTDRQVHILSGFSRLVEISPLHNPIPVFVEDGKAKIIQDFEVRGFDLPDDFMFRSNLRLNPGANVNMYLLPSVNIVKNSLVRIEQGRYRLTYDLELLAGTIEETIAATVHLIANNLEHVAIGTEDLREWDFVNQDLLIGRDPIYRYEYRYEYIFNFNPSVFELNIDLNVPRVTTPEGGWR